MPKKKQERVKTPQMLRLDNVHWDIIEDLMPFYGNTPAEVCRTIIIMWLDAKYGSPTIEKLEREGKIKMGRKSHDKEKT